MKEEKPRKNIQRKHFGSHVASRVLGNELERRQNVLEWGFNLNRVINEGSLGRGYLSQDHKKVRE